MVKFTRSIPIDTSCKLNIHYNSVFFCSFSLLLLQLDAADDTDYVTTDVKGFQSVRDSGTDDIYDADDLLNATPMTNNNGIYTHTFVDYICRMNFVL
jgi:hypothetical protein